MKIQCQTCNARYAIADHKICGRKVSVRCRKCGETIRVVGATDAWHLCAGGETEGPFNLAALRRRAAALADARNTLFWREGMADWKSGAEVPELQSLFGSAPPTAGEPAPNLFEDAAMEPSAPTPEELTGSRNESSVLFSLSNLADLSRGQTAPSATTETTTAATSSRQDGSGLIDIRALAATVGFEAGAHETPAAEELLSFGSDLGAPLLSPVIVPAPAKSRSKLPLVLGATFALLIAGLGVAIIGAIQMRRAAAVPAPGTGRVASEAPLESPLPSPAGHQSSVGIPTAVERPAAEPDPGLTLADEPVPRPEPPSTAPPTRPRPRITARTRARVRRPIVQTTARNPPPSRPEPRSPTAPASDDHDPLADIFNPQEPAARPSPTRTLPPTPSRAHVVAAMRSVSPEVSRCAGSDRGMATVRFRFSSDGQVESASVVGGSLPPASRSCVATAARRAEVPPFARPSFSVNYPFRL